MALNACVCKGIVGRVWYNVVACCVHLFWPGSDYSAAAVQLARSVAAARGVASVRWLEDDFLHASIPDRCAVN